MTDTQTTAEQERAIKKLVAEYGASGWNVSVDRTRETVIVTAYGGPRAMRMLAVHASGTVTTLAMA